MMVMYENWNFPASWKYNGFGVLFFKSMGFYIDGPTCTACEWIIPGLDE